MLRRFRADLHIHTALSPCASDELTPPALLAAAKLCGIDVIGAVDHNATGNGWALVEAAARPSAAPVRVLPGLEVESVEGVHVVCLSDKPDEAEAMQHFVWARLPAGANRPEILGEQWLMDPAGQQIRQEDRLLAQATGLSLGDICRESRRRGLLTLPAHVTRRSHGLFGVLGFMPEELEIDGLELGPTCAHLTERAQQDLQRGPRVASSDAHQLEQIGESYTDFWLSEPTVAELRLALQQRDGRRAVIVRREL